MEYIEINKLIPFREHIFSLYEGERLDNLVASIKQLGVLNPVICRPFGITGNYEILSGHNRVNAAKLAGLTEVPYTSVFPESDEEAMLIVIESNFMQRSLEEMKISERAKSIAKWHSCLKKQGQRTDLISEIERVKALENSAENESDFCPSNTDENKDSELLCTGCTNENLSPRSIYKYLRISQLSDPILERMDKFEISIKAAVELSYLSGEQQETLEIVLSANENVRVTERLAKELRKCSESNKLSDVSAIEKVLSGEVLDKRKVPKRKVVLKEKFLFQYFDKSADDKVISQRLEQSLRLTEQTIPQICKEHNYETTDYDELVTEALNKYFTDKT